MLFLILTAYFLSVVQNERCNRMKRNFFKIILFSFIFQCLISPPKASGQKKFSIEILPGAAGVLPSKLKLYQKGYDDIVFRAKYKVESFRLPIYYSVRMGYEINERFTLEAELNHLKLFLQNNPDEITWFSISHGYNQLWFNVLKKGRLADIRAGIGPVVGHPENTVRGKKLDEDGGIGGKGYYINGITSQIAAQKKIYLGKYIFLSGESKLNVSFARTKVSDGYADVRVFAFHVLAGAGISF